MKNRNYSKLKETIDNFICEYQDDEELGEVVKGLTSGNSVGHMILYFEGDVGTRYIPHFWEQMRKYSKRRMHCRAADVADVAEKQERTIEICTFGIAD